MASSYLRGRGQSVLSVRGAHNNRPSSHDVFDDNVVSTLRQLHDIGRYVNRISLCYVPSLNRLGRDHGVLH